MSKSTKKSGGLNIRPNSAKTLLARAKREIPGFREHVAKFEQQLTIGGYSSSTLFNYSRAVAKVSLHFQKSLLELDPEEVNVFLYQIARARWKSLMFCRLNAGRR